MPHVPLPTVLPAPMSLPNLPALAAGMGVDLSSDQVAQLGRYAAWLVAVNQAINLTAITEPAAVEVKHLADSLSLAGFVDRWAEAAGVDARGPLRVIDVGTGGGLPGVPLAIVRPAWRVTLVDSVAKKARVVEQGLGLLGLSDRVRVLADRVENLGHARDHRDHYDVAVARAVASLPALAEWLLPLVRVGGCVLCPRGDKDAGQADPLIELLRRHFPGTLTQFFDAAVPGLPGRQVAVLLKTRPTPKVFPRPVGSATSKPLE